MEKADGSLESLAPPEGYNTPRGLALFREILLGVEAVHAAGIIHRDLKPANILLVNDVAKVADTGLCLIVGENRATPTDEAVGPRYYMAPELEHGRNLDVDYRADLYSLGKLLYWLLSGGVNLPRESFNDPDRRLWRMRSPGLEVFHRIFDKTLTTHRSSRFRSATALLSAFDGAVGALAQAFCTLFVLIAEKQLATLGRDGESGRSTPADASIRLGRVPLANESQRRQKFRPLPLRARGCFP